MKHFFLFLSLCPFFVFTQTEELQKYVSEGVKQHDQGNFEKALEYYNKALEIDENSSLAHYEMAMTYSAMGEYEKTIEHCDIVLGNDYEHQLHTYVVKGSALDEMGEPKKAIKTYKKGIKKEGDHYLLYYNMALVYFKLEDLKNTEKALHESIRDNPNHDSSHLLMAYVMASKSYTSQAILCLSYFLILEPASSRSVTAFELLNELIEQNVSKSEDGKEIQINLGSEKNEDFRPAMLMLAMSGIDLDGDIETEEGDTIKLKDVDPLQKSLAPFYTVLGEFKDDKKNKGLWWDSYVPFFYTLSSSEHIETFCKYISITSMSEEEAETWIDNNKKEIEAFIEWFNLYKLTF